MSKRALWILIGAFLVSVAVRAPQLNRPLSAHHEYCTAFTLIALTNWYEDGFAYHHGMPSGGFISEGERFLPPSMSRNDRATALYYFSHPPLAYDLPYILFSITRSAPNVAGLQGMNLFFHLVAALGMFFAVKEVVGAGHGRAPLYAAVLYLFLPATLWFHSNVYMSDMFVQVPWIWHLYFAIRILKTDAKRTASSWIGFTFSSFLVLYTSWLGVFAMVAAVVAAGWTWRQHRSTPVLWIVGSCLAATLAAFSITAWRYLQVIDAEALMAHFASRFAVRGSFAMSQGLLPLLGQILLNYRIGFLPIIVLLVFLMMRWWRSDAPKQLPAPARSLFILLTALPVILDHAFLLQYAEHDFAALKAAPLFCGSAAIALERMDRMWSRALLALTCLLGVLYFYHTNPLPGHDGGRYAQEKDLGTFIAANALPNELVFGVGVSTEPQVAWYARRNVLGVASAESARAYLTDRGLAFGVVIASQNGRLTATPIAP